jgi:hypothetical protein
MRTVGTVARLAGMTPFCRSPGARLYHDGTAAAPLAQRTAPLFSALSSALTGHASKDDARIVARMGQRELQVCLSRCRARWMINDACLLPLALLRRVLITNAQRRTAASNRLLPLGSYSVSSCP